MLSQYLSTRFGILKFAGFTGLLVLLSITEIPQWQIVAENFVFVFASLFAFRLLDDTWSFHLDRIHHPQRTYLLAKNIKSLIIFTVIVFTVYLGALFLFSWDFAMAILILFLVSSVLYGLFFKDKIIMTLIPLLKYPVLIWCISQFSISSQVLLLSSGAFFMMLTSDFIELKKTTPSLQYQILLFLITGILIFQAPNPGLIYMTDLVFISITVLLLAFTSMKEKPFYPIIIFPVLHIVDLILSR